MKRAYRPINAVLIVKVYDFAVEVSERLCARVATAGRQDGNTKKANYKTHFELSVHTTLD